jgi:hypothetical protein
MLASWEPSICCSIDPMEPGDAKSIELRMLEKSAADGPEEYAGKGVPAGPGGLHSLSINTLITSCELLAKPCGLLPHVAASPWPR